MVIFLVQLKVLRCAKVYPGSLARRIPLGPALEAICVQVLICCSAPAFQFHVLGTDSMDVPDYKVGLGLLWVSDGWGPESKGFKNFPLAF